MRRLLTIFLSVSFVSCATYDREGIYLSWEFLENEKGETKACLSKEDVESLRKEMIRCRR
jgi:hypothetical protein